MNKDATRLFSRLILSDKPVRVKLLGDSITHGVGGTGWKQNGEHIVDDFYRSPDSFCWAKLFKDYLEGHYNCTVVNNGCTGTRVEFITEHFDELVDDEDDLVLCTIGTNNRHHRYEWGECPTREAHMRLTYERMVALYQKFAQKGKDVVFVANIPAGLPSERDGTEYRRLLHMNDIQDLWIKASLENDFPLICLYTKFRNYCQYTGTDLNSLLDDTLHPNDRGYEIMFSLLMEELGLTEALPTL